MGKTAIVSTTRSNVGAVWRVEVDKVAPVVVVTSGAENVTGSEAVNSSDHYQQLISYHYPKKRSMSMFCHTGIDELNKKNVKVNLLKKQVNNKLEPGRTFCGLSLDNAMTNW